MLKRYVLKHVLICSHILCAALALEPPTDPTPPWPWRPSEYVTQVWERRFCRFPLPSPSLLVNVCDPDQLLREEEVLELSMVLSRAWNESTCSDHQMCDHVIAESECGGGGVAMGVALAKQTLQEHTAKEFAEDVRRKWSLLSPSSGPQKRCDPSLVVFVSAHEHQISISFGERSERVFGHSFSQLIVNHMQRAFKGHNSSLFEFLVNCTQYLRRTYCTRFELIVLPNTTNTANHETFIWITWKNTLVTLISVLLLLLLLIGLFYSHRRRGGGGQAREGKGRRERIFN